MRRVFLVLTMTGLAMTARAQAQFQTPPQIAARITALDVACTAAGGRPSGRTYIVTRDFTGDGQPDFMLSEGSYGCTGRPDLFRQGGKGVVEVYAGDGRGGAVRVYRQAVAMVRVQAMAPVVEVVRDAAGCGEGVARFAACGLKLTWDARARQMVETPAGTGPAPASVDSLASAARPPASMPSAMVESQAQFVARCAAGRRGRYPELTNAQASSYCQDDWKMVVASKPIIDGLKALTPGQPTTTAAVKASLAGVVWPPKTPNNGRLGKLDVLVEGSPVKQVSWTWDAVGQPIPYNAAEAVRASGGSLTLIGCESLGLGEGAEIYRAALPGKPAFALTISHREAPTASATSSYSVMADLTGVLPTLRGLNAKGGDYKARCED